jgi:hypothetical protein
MPGSPKLYIGRMLREEPPQYPTHQSVGLPRPADDDLSIQLRRHGSRRSFVT